MNAVHIDGRRWSILMGDKVQMDGWIQSLFMDEFSQYLCMNTTVSIDGWITSLLINECSPFWLMNTVHIDRWILCILMSDYSPHWCINTVNIEGWIRSVWGHEQSIFMSKCSQYWWMNTFSIDDWLQSILMHDYSPYCDGWIQFILMDTYSHYCCTKAIHSNYIVNSECSELGIFPVTTIIMWIECTLAHPLNLRLARSMTYDWTTSHLFEWLQIWNL